MALARARGVPLSMWKDLEGREPNLITLLIPPRDNQGYPSKVSPITKGHVNDLPEKVCLIYGRTAYLL